MKTIRISEEVWNGIAQHGKFGETEDDVLKRIMNIPTNSKVCDGQDKNVTQGSSFKGAGSRRRTFADRRMSTYINSGALYSEFQNGPSDHWILPDRSDKAGIRNTLDKLIAFAESNKATIGQINAARKTLTDQGYHLTK
jgi:hypothetical protein